MSKQSSQFKTCPSCQGFVTKEDETCAFCGAKQLKSWEARLFSSVKQILPAKSPATTILLIVLSLYFILICVDVLRSPNAGVMQILMTPPTKVLWFWGAHIRGDFEPWRFVMANFVHIGLIHVFFNFSALKAIGPLTERYFGASLTLSLFLFIGTGSMLVSNVLGESGIVAGASGGLMGFIGLVASGARRTKALQDKKISNAMWMSAAFVMLFGLVLSFSNTMGIDNIAHASGFILGVLLGLVLPVQGLTGFSSIWPIRASAISLLLALALLAWALTSMLGNTSMVVSEEACIKAIEERRPASSVSACYRAYEQAPRQISSINNLILAYRMAHEDEKADALCEEAKKILTEDEFAKISQRLCFEASK